MFGRIEKPARIWLTPTTHPEAPPGPSDACIPVPARWLASLQTGDGVRFTDTRNARRLMTVTEVVGHSRWAESLSTGYVAPGLILTAVSKDKPKHRRRGRVGNRRAAAGRVLPPVAGPPDPDAGAGRIDRSVSRSLPCAS
jgi:hypothetical protein